MRMPGYAPAWEAMGSWRLAMIHVLMEESLCDAAFVRD